MKSEKHLCVYGLNWIGLWCQVLSFFMSCVGRMKENNKNTTRFRSVWQQPTLDRVQTYQPEKLIHILFSFLLFLLLNAFKPMRELSLSVCQMYIVQCTQWWLCVWWRCCMLLSLVWVPPETIHSFIRCKCNTYKQCRRRCRRCRNAFAARRFSVSVCVCVYNGSALLLLYTYFSNFIWLYIYFVHFIRIRRSVAGFTIIELHVFYIYSL